MDITTYKVCKNLVNNVLINGGGADLTEYAKKDHTHNYTTEEEVKEIIKENGGTGNVDLTGYVREEQLDNYSEKDHVHEKYTTVPAVIQLIQENCQGGTFDPTGPITEIREVLDNKLDKPVVDGTAGQILVLQDDGSLAYQDNVSEFDDKVNKTDITTTIDSSSTDTQIPSAKATYDLVNTKANTNHTHTASDIKGLSIPTKVSELTNDKNYISSIPSEYVTETELTAKKYLTSIPSTYALKTDIPTVPTKTSQLTNDSNFITSIPAEYITETELKAKGYLTSHQDISGLQTKTDNNLTTTDKTVIGAINEVKLSIPTRTSELVKKTDITDTIDINSSGTKIPNVKAIYNDIIEGKLIDQTVMDTYGTEILKYPLGIWRIGGDSLSTKFSDLPVKTSGRIEITSIDANINKTPWNNTWSYRTYTFETHSGTNYSRKLSNGGTVGVIEHDTGWQKVCVTKVADVSKTTLTPVFPNGVIVGSGGVAINYIVRNGWCNVNFVFNITSATTFSWTDIATGLPKPANSVDIALMNAEGKINRPIVIKINSTGSVSSRVPAEISATDWWVSNISYPVAE